MAETMLEKKRPSISFIPNLPSWTGNQASIKLELMQNYPFYHSNFPRDGVGIQQTPLSNQSPQKRRTVFNGLKARPLSRPDARRQQRCDSTKLNSNLGASLPKNSSKPPSHPLGGQAVNFPPIRFFKYQPTNHIFFAHR